MTKEKNQNKFKLKLFFHAEISPQYENIEETLEVDGTDIIISLYNTPSVCQGSIYIWNQTSEVSSEAFDTTQKFLEEIFSNTNLVPWNLEKGPAVLNAELRCSFSKKVSIGDEVINSSKSSTLNLVTAKPLEIMKTIEEFYNKEKS